MLDPEAVEAFIAETTEKYRRYLNPSLSNLLKFMGFGTVPECSRGATLTDVAGEEWLGFLGGLGVFTLGPSHPKVVAALRAQLEQLPLTIPIFLNRRQADLAELLAEVLP